MSRPSRIGFTLVEAGIADVVIIVLMAILVPFLREQERQRLQALADVKPWEVFELRAEPAKERFSDHEEIVPEIIAKLERAENALGKASP